MRPGNRHTREELFKESFPIALRREITFNFYSGSFTASAYLSLVLLSMFDYSSIAIFCCVPLRAFFTWADFERYCVQDNLAQRQKLSCRESQSCDCVREGSRSGLPLLHWTK